MNAFEGQITANAAVLSASTSVYLYAPEASDFLLDINGYFAR